MCVSGCDTVQHDRNLPTFPLTAVSGLSGSYKYLCDHQESSLSERKLSQISWMFYPDIFLMRWRRIADIVMLPGHDFNRVSTECKRKALAVRFDNETIDNPPGITNMKWASTLQWTNVTALTVLKVNRGFPHFTYKRCVLRLLPLPHSSLPSALRTQLDSN
jgi:hypothetical protein